MTFLQILNYMNIKKLFLKIHKIFTPHCDDTISIEERNLMIIVKKLISKQDADLMLTPHMHKAYIVDADKQLFVCLDFNNSTASVINHKFGYNIHFNQRVSAFLDRHFSDEVEKRRLAMENEFRNNVQFSLATIIKRLDKSTNIQ